ncbi:MAG: DEAD/DEAH box helicase, partial [Verrucomicrobia bacterium]|nr:DEAD/DEAH box helicase [Verrucomicrobiota bacterium]
MNSIGAQLDNLHGLTQVAVPDLWQQTAVAALREGKDVVVHAPTGAGKTLIFELWSNQGKNRGQAIYTVPTRALANDKLAEWRARGWNVGISTGDLSHNLEAPVIVATLETQKQRLVRGDGPSLLVVDEYQLIGDEDRGLNYELALALSPGHTQLLLLSGSVANPQDLVKWLRRLGRDAVLVRHENRPVPLEEVHTRSLSYHLPNEIRGYWPRLIAKALAEDLGPILIFAPRRQAAESMASELVRNLPTPNPLALTPEQKALVGDHLAKLLKARISYHHSGLSYAVRAGVVEPLAKAGQLRVVVATMGLAAGINFSLRSVALAGSSYRRDSIEQPVRADEILQMFGRAGRRGLDETGYVLITANEIRLLDAHTGQLTRGRLVDWSALLGIMDAAVLQGRAPFKEAMRIQTRLFTTKPISLGVEISVQHPNVPCGLPTDSERARHVRRLVREFLNSQGVWESCPKPVEKPLREVFLALPQDSPQTSSSATNEAQPSRPPSPRLLSILTSPSALERIGTGQLVVVGKSDDGPIHGRSTTVADRINGDRILLAKWARRLVNWNRRQASLSVWRDKIAPLVEEKMAGQKTPIVRFRTHSDKIVAEVSLEEHAVRVPVDSHGVALWRPAVREVLQPECTNCLLQETCRAIPTATGVALLWRRLGLVDQRGFPTRRGKIVSFFSQGDGLAIAAGLEDESYRLEEMAYDLANLDAGFRFCGDENRWGGRLAMACQQAYGLKSIAGYLENGVPQKYGAGAEQVVASVHINPSNKQLWVTDLLGAGDIDRIIIEWRSLMRRIAHSPEMDWERWMTLRALARTMLNETESPTLTELPPLD